MYRYVLQSSHGHIKLAFMGIKIKKNPDKNIFDSFFFFFSLTTGAANPGGLPQMEISTVHKRGSFFNTFSRGLPDYPYIL